ncbi:MULTISPECIES: DUF2845 domain-containing protein [Pseudomonas]|uniref:DUF2845 domain-containing protein n=1 Tax=Pseudomonas kuykendallii TaxID=1007099 RepID=A0A2W5ENB5_9PSED|nr:MULTISPECIES: DUF2845 domain-containing protein [Pseudomonas]PZP21486.1 MAG: hypothetical protein DI599_18830 [Pseudomonas kuykendallii]
MSRWAIGALLGVVASTGMAADSMRCGSNLVSVGDRAFEVENKCGAPRERDLVGFTDGYSRADLKIEEWIYGPNNGMLYILRFEGNRLIRIESRRP